MALVYDDAGPADGMPVVLCHGLGAAALQFAADREFFAGRGFRVLVPDLRGHGRSGKAADYAVRRMALDLVEMLAHAGVGSVHWVGNSLGGILALSLLGSHPAIFRSLATFGTSYALNLPRFGAAMIPLTYRLLGRNLTATLTAMSTTRDKAARALIRSILLEHDPAVGAAVAAEVVRYDLIARGVEATVPILMLRGGRDRAVNRALGPTLKAMQGLPHFNLVEVPQGGHCANLDATDDVRRALLAFWEKYGG